VKNFEKKITGPQKMKLKQWKLEMFHCDGSFLYHFVYLQALVIQFTEQTIVIEEGQDCVDIRNVNIKKRRQICCGVE
jgi:hypothetical protein